MSTELKRGDVVGLVERDRVQIAIVNEFDPDTNSLDLYRETGFKDANLQFGYFKSPINARPIIRSLPGVLEDDDGVNEMRKGFEDRRKPELSLLGKIVAKFGSLRS